MAGLLRYAHEGIKYVQLRRKAVIKRTAPVHAIWIYSGKIVRCRNGGTAPVHGVATLVGLLIGEAIRKNSVEQGRAIITDVVAGAATEIGLIRRIQTQVQCNTFQ